MVVLTAYYSSRIAQISRLRVLEAVADFGVPWRALAEQQLVGILDNKPGRNWFLQNFEVDAELFEVGQGILATNPDCTRPLLAGYPEQVIDEL